MSTFSEIWFYTKLSTSALTNVLRILTTEAPVAHQSARHSQRRSAELTCSSSQKPTIVHARFVQHNLAASSRRPYPLSPCRERQAERASAEQRNQQRGDASWGTLPASTLWGFTAHTKHSANVGTAAITSTSVRHPVCR